MLVCGGSDNEVRVLSSDRQFANISVYTLSHKAPIIGCYFFGNGYDVCTGYLCTLPLPQLLNKIGGGGIRYAFIKDARLFMLLNSPSKKFLRLE